MLSISIGGIPYELTESDEGLVLVKALQVGATKEKNGKTYVLNENKRWTLKREEGAAPKKQRSVKPKDAAKPASETKPVAPAKEKKPLKPKSEAKPKLTPIEGGSKSKGKGKAKLKQIEGGKQKPVEQMSLKEMFAEGDRVGSKYQTEPKSLDERREAKAGAQQFMDETGATIASARASGKVRQLKPKVSSDKSDPGVVDAKRGKKQATNSRIVGAKEAAKYFQGYDQATQLGWLNHHVSLMDSLDGSQSYMDMANSHFNQVWEKAAPEVKSKISQKWGGKVKNPLVAKLLGGGGALESTPVETKPTPNRPKVTPRKGERKSLRPKAQTPIEHIETSPEIQAAAAQSPKIASAIQQIKKNPSILEKVQAAAINNPGAVEDIAVAAIAMAGQFALMPQADLATAALMQGAIGVATRAGARAGKRIREELKTDPNTLKSLQGAIKLGKGILSDLMSKETQEKMISDAIGPAMAAGTGAAVGGGLAGTVAGTGAAVGAAPKAAGAIRQTIANKLQPKRKPLALKNG